MCTYIIYKEFIYDVLIDYLWYEDCLSKALCIIAVPIFSILGLLFVVFDILTIPFYIFVGVLTLIIKMIEITRKR